MKISLITACFNSADTLGTALESVLRQKDADFEYLVIDGGSTDGTADLLKAYEAKFNGRMRWVSERDDGMYDAINKGIGMATGDVIGILNANDVLADDEVLGKIAGMFDTANDELQCLYGNVRFVRPMQGLDALRAARTHRWCFAKLWRPWMLQWGYMPPHPGIFIRRECFGQWGGYVPSRTEYRIAADYELLIRFFRVHRMKACYMPICTTVMRTGGVSTRNVEARKKLNEEIIKGNRANGYLCIWPMLLPKYLIKIWEVILPRLGFY